MNETQGWILHSRPYQNTSLLLDIWTEQHGRMKLVARGAHRPKHGVSLAQILQPYRLLWFVFGGRSELKTLYQAEILPNQPEITLHGKANLCALYIHELLIKLLPIDFVLPNTYHAYHDLLTQLMISLDSQLNNQNIFATLSESLRNFEKIFLTEMGYAPNYAAYPQHSKQQVHQHLFAPLLGNQPLQTKKIWQDLYLKNI